MRLYKVPFQSEEKLKIIGGFISGYQAVCLGTGLLIAPLLYLLKIFPLWSRIILIILVAVLSIVFAFVKAWGLNVARFIYYYLKYKVRKRSYWLNSND